MRPFNLADAIAGAVPLDGVMVEYRANLFDPTSGLFFTVPAGGSIDDIVAALIAEGIIPRPFPAYGSAFVSSEEEVQADLWHEVRPKAGGMLFLGPLPADGDGTFGLIATLAVAAFAVAVSGGALATLAPGIFSAGAFGAGTIGAQLLGAGIAVGGSLLINSFAKTPQLGGGGANTQPLGVAGIGGNPLGNTQPIPIVRGRIRVSPPIVAAPFTQIIANGQMANVIYGVRAPVVISDTMIDGIDVADMAQVEIEQRDGYTDTSPLTLITTSGFEETVNVQLRKQELLDDGETLFTPAPESYPLPYVMKSRRNMEQFRIILSLPGGLRDNTGTDHHAILPLRIRVKPEGGSWINFPELILTSQILTPMRREILFNWAFSQPLSGASTALLVAYVKNPSWTADSYFNNGVTPTGVDTSVWWMQADSDKVVFALAGPLFPIGPAYTFEITRGYAYDQDDFTPSTYKVTGGADAAFFTFQTTSGSDLKIPIQDHYSAEIYVESYASMRGVYPIEQDGLALTALRVRNRKVNSLSQIYESIVPIWDGTDWDTMAASRNPAALALDVLRNADNFVFALPDSKIDWDSWQDFYEHCDDEGLTFDGLISDGSIEDPVRSILAAGDAELRRDGEVVGVVIDRDRSGDGAACLITPAVMVRPLTMEKNFDPYTTALVATFLDEDDDYAAKEIFVDDDGFMLNGRHIIEAVDVPGITNEAGAIRWCKIYLRRLRFRRLKYSFGVDLDHLLFKRGDLIKINHDMLTNCYGSGRLVSYTTSGGNLLTLTLDTDMLDAPPEGYDSLFEVPNVFTLADFFTLTEGPIGAELRLKDGYTATIPIASVSGKTLTVEGTFAVPNGIEQTSLVAIGPRGSEGHRVVVGDISKDGDRQALVTCFAEVSKLIFMGL